MPKPCAFRCTNTPGSFACVCPPGQLLLGDGKSCAGLERLPNSGAYYSSYNYAQFSPLRDNHQPQQYYRHSSNLYTSFSEYRNSRIPFSRTRRNVREICPEGYEARNDRCVGKCQSYLFFWSLLLGYCITYTRGWGFVVLCFVFILLWSILSNSKFKLALCLSLVYIPVALVLPR